MKKLLLLLAILIGCNGDPFGTVSYFWRGICTMENGLEWQGVPQETEESAYYDALDNGPPNCTRHHGKKFIHVEPTRFNPPSDEEL